MPSSRPDGDAIAVVTRREPDAHGQAALLLAEATLHLLIEAKLLTPAQAASAARTATEVKVEVAEEIGESDGTMRESVLLLHRIEVSLNADSSSVGAEGLDGAAWRTDGDGAA